MESATGSRAGRLVVGYDGSADAERGLDWAIDYARLRGLPIEVFASSGDLEYLPERTSADVAALVDAWLLTASDRLRDSGLTDWTTTASQGKVVPELLEISRSAEMVVVGAQGHGLLGGMLLGSVSQHLSRHAACPVVVVRGPRSEKPNRIVVGVDGSDAAEKALRFAFEHAAVTGGTVVAVHGRMVAAVNGPFDTDVAPAVHGELESMRRLLDEAVAGARSEFPDVPVELLPLPVPAVRALADASVNASLMVVGTRGLGGFMGLLLGSVSSSVLQHAHCPVAVVR
jgi:nucleotide-binding universal stress UspA family protein